MLICEPRIPSAETSSLAAVGISCDRLTLSVSTLGLGLTKPHEPFLARLVLFLTNVVWDQPTLLWRGQQKRPGGQSPEVGGDGGLLPWP